MRRRTRRRAVQRPRAPTLWRRARPPPAPPPPSTFWAGGPWLRRARAATTRWSATPRDPSRTRSVRTPLRLSRGGFDRSTGASAGTTREARCSPKKSPRASLKPWQLLRRRCPSRATIPPPLQMHLRRERVGEGSAAPSAERPRAPRAPSAPPQGRQRLRAPSLERRSGGRGRMASPEEEAKALRTHPKPLPNDRIGCVS
mmetsp:Transcript_30961/g.100861  ORF Transcript_30961/g.100861 Transcript_30961/m.100861 type:complete len:200 (-) Transcript_30961:1035-1634(-)